MRAKRADLLAQVPLQVPVSVHTSPVMQVLTPPSTQILLNGSLHRSLCTGPVTQGIVWRSVGTGPLTHVPVHTSLFAGPCAQAILPTGYFAHRPLRAGPSVQVLLRRCSWTGPRTWVVLHCTCLFTRVSLPRFPSAQVLPLAQVLLDRSPCAGPITQLFSQKSSYAGPFAQVLTHTVPAHRSPCRVT